MCKIVFWDKDKKTSQRVENYTSLITLSYLGAFFATMFGTMVGYMYYPWAYASASGHYAMIVLTVVEALGYIFCVKVAEEGTNKNSNGQITVALVGTTAIMLYVALYVS